MRLTPGDGRGARNASYVNGCRGLDGPPVAQLTVSTLPPTLYDTFPHYSARMRRTRGDGRSPRGDPRYVNGGQGVDAPPVAQLAVVVVTPTFDGTPREDGACMIISRGDGRGARGDIIH